MLWVKLPSNAQTAMGFAVIKLPHWSLGNYSWIHGLSPSLQLCPAASA